MTSIRAILLGRRSLGMIALAAAASSLFFFSPGIRPEEKRVSDGSREFTQNVQPLLKQYCLRCHSTKKKKGDLDLEQFSSPAQAQQKPRVWQKVLEMVHDGEMPPKDSKQPTPAERQNLLRGIHVFLNAEARARAGDPGRVVLRRLNNVEYNHTVRDLTGIDLQPAREFPADGAAGEGFANSGEALAMSPALLTKYFDAAKEIAAHAVLLPGGFRFSPGTTRRDWTDAIVADIRKFYGRFADAEGRVPLEKYLAATLELRADSKKSVTKLAAERGLNARYLQSLWQVLHDRDGSYLLESIRKQWLAAGPQDAPRLAADISRWQQVQWKFNNVGHFKPWQVPAEPLAASRDFRIKLPSVSNAQEIVVYLSASTAGDNNRGSGVLWQEPRLEAPGRPTIFLRDLRRLASHVMETRRRSLANTAKYLSAAAFVQKNAARADATDLARQRGLDPNILTAWLAYLGFVPEGAVAVESYMTNKIMSSGGYKFVQGWGVPATPNLAANASDQQVRIPGIMKPHSVAMHPSPTLFAAVGWKSPLAGAVRIEARAIHAHPECGNGISWSLEWRRGSFRRKLASGLIERGGSAKIEPVPNLAVQPGDLVSLLIGPRNADHSCDLTEVDLVITAVKGGARRWHLAGEVANDILAGNPHADRQGNRDIWHFYQEKVGAAETMPTIPPGSLLARWLATESLEEKNKLADKLQQLLVGGEPASKNHPDTVLYRQLRSLSGPLFAGLRQAPSPAATDASGTPFGLDSGLFGKNPSGKPIAANSLVARAPSVLEVRLPADLIQGRDFVVSGSLAPGEDIEGSVQLQVSTAKPQPSGLTAGSPIVVRDGSRAKTEWQRALADFRRWFPAAVCYARIVPVDEVITLVLFHREDEHLCRLMLDDHERATLDHLWRELRYVSQDAQRIHQAFDVFQGFASQENRTKEFEPLRKPIRDRALALQKLLTDTEPVHVNALVKFAARAYRRPLTPAEEKDLRVLYRKLRDTKLPHEEAFRLTLARILVAPSFLYRIEQPAPGKAAQPISDWELASRLSYFLWASMPDEKLLQTASQGTLRDPEQLAAEGRRLLKDPRVRGLATEFACQWLGIRDFDKHEEKSERHFPTFVSLRGAMYEEAVRFFVDLFQRDGSVLEILDADHTFVNEALARHYGIPNMTGPEWRRVDGMKRLSRGGVLGMAVTLSKQSGASRTSPILRGNWVTETLLGEKLPRPPRNVPQLPSDEAATDGLTMRQLVEKHRSIAQCAVCHDRIDAFGFALESFDAIGRRRNKDMGGRLINTRVELRDGSKFADIDGLRSYLLEKRKNEFLRTFCRKLLGYSLGRGLHLSDEVLLEEMMNELGRRDYRFSAAVETILRSQPFRYVRGALSAREEDE
jgi:uncharacterized protein DUF1592/uncharacterized protein DUF1588/uncharacterized protein DUF1587/uncharacterized protein DUF1585/uncharacterized protein DUF1595/cytochrome c